MFIFERLMSAIALAKKCLSHAQAFMIAQLSLIGLYVKYRAVRLTCVQFCVSFMALALSFAGSTAAHAQAGPFTCDGDIFQVQSGQLRIFDPIVSSYVDIGPQNSGYNATGFNILDNFVDDITFSGTVQNVADAAYVRDGSDDYLIGFAAGRTGIFDLNTGVARRTTVSGLPGGTYGATQAEVMMGFLVSKRRSQICRLWPLMMILSRRKMLR